MMSRSQESVFAEERPWVERAFKGHPNLYPSGRVLEFSGISLPASEEELRRTLAEQGIRAVSDAEMDVNGLVREYKPTTVSCNLSLIDFAEMPPDEIYRRGAERFLWQDARSLEAGDTKGPEIGHLLALVAQHKSEIMQILKETGKPIIFLGKVITTTSEEKAGTYLDPNRTKTMHHRHVIVIRLNKLGGLVIDTEEMGFDDQGLRFSPNEYLFLALKQG